MPVEYLESLRRSNRIVVKLGTNVVTSQFGLAEGRLRVLVREIGALRSLNKEIILVSSGAVGLGRRQIIPGSASLSLVEKQACAAVGQSLLMAEYHKLFSDADLGPTAKIAQILLTSDDFFNRSRYLSLRATLNKLLSLKVVPIINENDPVSDNELRSSKRRSFGDNDMLSALVASKLAADVLVILTDVDGLFSENPIENPQAEHIREIERKEQLKKLKIGTGSKEGRGGIQTKIEAARTAAAFQVPTVIASGLKDRVLTGIFGFAGEAPVPRFTLFRPLKSLAKKSKVGLYGT